MDIFSSCTEQIESLVQRLGSSLERGIGADEARKRLKRYGANTIERAGIKWWHILVRQIQNPFSYLLFGAALFSLSLGEILNAAMIGLFLLINLLLGFYQEYFAERTSEILSAYLQSFSLVIRDGQTIRIPTDQLVVGDLVTLEFGDVVPADVRLVEATDLMVDESTLSGESLPRPKRVAVLIERPHGISEAENVIFSSSKVVGGHARGIVVATGMGTLLGTIAKNTMTTNSESSFAREINSFARLMMIIVLISLGVALLVNLIFRPGAANLGNMLLFSISLAVAVIPEALPVVITFARSIGARRLAREKVIIKRLSALEELGGTQILCTDKTGTLTQNTLSVANVFGHDPRSVITLARTAGAAPGGQPSIFDVAIDAYLAREQQQVHPAGYVYRDSLPFDPYRRLSAQLIEYDHTCVIYVRGAGSELTRMCDIAPGQREKIEQWLEREEKEGNRVLAIATKEIDKSMQSRWMTHFTHLHFVGLISFADPLKPSARAAIDRARALHVEVKMLTGDSATVASHIARSAGLNIDADQMIEGAPLSALSPAQREIAIEHCSIFGRIDPDQKFEIIRSLQRTHSVAFLGEGVNDAPALKEAQVGIAVDNATSIAQDAADVIILANDLNILVHGIQEGRRVFVNTLKYIKVTISSNLSNLYTMIIAMLLLDYLPMLPLQLLLVNILSDLPMIAISTDTVDPADLRRPQEYRVSRIIVHTMAFGIICTLCDFVFLARMYHQPAAQLQTLWFIYSILSEFCFFFSLRTHKFIFYERMPSKAIFGMFGAVMVVTLALPYTSLGKNIFGFAHPGLNHLVWIGLVLVLTITLLEIAKWVMKRRFNTSF